MVHPGTATEVAAQLQGAADIGAGYEVRTRSAEVVSFEPTQFGCFFRLDKVVDPSTAAADAGFCGLLEAEARNGSQQLTRLGLNALAVDHVAGIVNGDCGRQRSQSLAKRFAETVIGQEFLHIQHRARNCSAPWSSSP